MANLTTSVGQILLNELLPEDMRDYHRVLDKKGMTALLRDVAERYPDKYREISHGLIQIGGRAAYETGGTSFGLRHLKRTEGARKIRDEIQKEMFALLDDESLSDEELESKLLDLSQKRQAEQQKVVLEEATKAGNPLATQVNAVGRGKPANLASLLGSDLSYVDHRDKPVPYPIRRNYAEGLEPLEYWTGGYGARKGTKDTKMATARSGYLSKVLNQLTHRLVVDADDDSDPPKTLRGFPVEVADNDSVGSLLAQPVGGYARNTVITPKILRDLESRGIQRVLIRSPILGGPFGGGVYAKDVGIRETGRFPDIGSLVGMTAAQSIGEPISQGSLCLREGTPVRMADNSVKKIEDVNPDEWVRGADKNGNTFPVKVLRRFDNGVRSCVRTTFREVKCRTRFLTLDSTLDHKVLAKVAEWDFGKSEWKKEYGVLPVGLKSKGFSAILPESVSCNLSIASDDSLLVGLLLGNGCYTESVHGVYFSVNDDLLLSQLESYLRPKNLRISKLQGHKYYHRVSSIEDVADHDSLGRFIPGDRNPAMVLIKSLGMWGKLAHEKYIPESLIHTDDTSLLSLIAGLWITDGSIYLTRVDRRDGSFDKPYLNFGSTNYQMCEQVREALFHRFAIYGAAINTSKGPSAKKRKRPMHTFTVTAHRSVQRFLQLVPLLGVKAARAKAWADNYKPAVDVAVAACNRLSQEPIGDFQTYDLEVDHPDHLFVLANGLIVSNSSKHSGGVAGEAKAVSGFDLLNSLVQMPKKFSGAATVSNQDGQVGTIAKAPAGGYHVDVNGEKHYIPPGLELKVQTGDKIEAGDVLSGGIPNPAEIVEHKGVGEGRRYFTKAFYQAMRDSGITAHRRNVELLARGLIDHVEFQDEWGDHLPGEIASYNDLERTWEPREGSQAVPARNALGKYLERPYLHYTVGTKVRPSVLKELEEFGVKDVEVHSDPPPFQARPVRAMYSLQHDPDWMTRMYGSGLKKSLLDSVHTGAVSDELGSSFVPALSRGVDFGSIGRVKLGEFAGDTIRPDTILDRLKHLKALSDAKQYRAKAALGNRLLTERPDEFFVDSAEEYMTGLTHRPTSFKFHLPRYAIPRQVLENYFRQIQASKTQEEVDDEGI